MRPALNRFGALACGALLAFSACDEEAISPPPSDADVLMVDASEDWAYVRLGEEATQVSVADAATSADWDLAFNATRVMLNGGAAGPAAVRGYCVCQNAAATDAQVQAMTPDSERGDFDAVDASSVPADAQAWETDALDPALADWYAYDMTTHTVTAVPSRVWKVRGAGGDPEYAKLHVTEIADGTQAGARVTIEFAVQPSAGEALGPVQSVVLDGRTAPVYFDFATGAVSDASDWDILLDGYELRVNGGVSGSGGAGAVVASETFDAMTDASDAPAEVYRADAFGGVFAARPWYRYDLDGNHTIFPTYDVYLIDTGGAVYKLQVIGYYDEFGDARHVSFRSSRLD